MDNPHLAEARAERLEHERWLAWYRALPADHPEQLEHAAISAARYLIARRAGAEAWHLRDIIAQAPAEHWPGTLRDHPAHRRIYYTTAPKGKER